jgi:predicted ATPase/DNA-binding winged helix-turn-helix (wHTH) protein
MWLHAPAMQGALEPKLLENSAGDLFRSPGGMKQFEAFRMDAANGRLWRDNRPIVLAPKPFSVLEYLVTNSGRLITQDELLDALWPETYVQPQVLRTYMLELRKALGDDAANPRFIQTLPKRGYCFVATVTDLTAGERVAPPSSAPAQAVTLNGRLPRFVNRIEELARLEAYLAHAIAGERQAVFVAGEAGIGKTALVDAFCRQAMMRNAALVARGQCVRGMGSREEYYPVLEALGQLCAQPDGQEASQILARIAPAWLTQDRQGSTEPSAPARTITDLCRALECLAAEKPLILVFEDLHWADGATLDLISALARRRGPVKLLLLSTYRPRSAEAENLLRELRHDLLVRKLSAEIAVAPLGRTALAGLLSAELRQEPLPAGLVEFVHRRSEGNPLFAIAIVEHLMARRELARRESDGTAHWELAAPFEDADADIPHELAQMVEAEVERLGPEEQRALEAASLMPVAFPAWAVAAALERDTAETEELLDNLARRLHFVERAGEDELPGGAKSAFYVFAHELYREVLYRRQAAARRAQRCVRIAERLGELFKGREADVAREMAMHFEAAGNWPRAVEALRAAAHHAERRLAHAEAAELRAHAEEIVTNGACAPDAPAGDR